MPVLEWTSSYVSHVLPPRPNVGLGVSTPWLRITHAPCSAVQTMSRTSRVRIPGLFLQLSLVPTRRYGVSEEAFKRFLHLIASRAEPGKQIEARIMNSLAAPIACRLLIGDRLHTYFVLCHLGTWEHV